MRMVAARLCAALAATLVVAGCSDEPSESEMRSAVEARTQRAVEAQGRPFPGFEAFRKQGCVDARDRPDGYDCYYAATLPAQAGQTGLVVNGKGWFHRTERGLDFVDLGAQPR